MQRKKMFLVVCLSALLAGSARGQNILPEKAKMISVRLDRGRESFLFPVIPAWEVSGWGKTGWGIVLPGRGPGNEGTGREAVGTGSCELQATSYKLQAGGWSRVGSWATMMGTTGELREWTAGAMVPADRVVTHFGFFCKRELELEKTIRLPLRFRLGSLEYCNRLEGK